MSYTSIYSVDINFSLGSLLKTLWALKSIIYIRIVIEVVSKLSGQWVWLTYFKEMSSFIWIEAMVYSSLYSVSYRFLKKIIILGLKKWDKSMSEQCSNE